MDRGSEENVLVGIRLTAAELNFNYPGDVNKFAWKYVRTIVVQPRHGNWLILRPANVLLPRR